MALSPEDAAFVCDQFGIDVDRPLLCQVSRFDPWKDPLGVIDAAIPTAPAHPAWPVRQVTKMFLAEVPPPYSGGTIGARGRIMPSIQVAGAYSFYPLYFNKTDGNYQVDTAEVAILQSLISLNEIFLIRFDYKGAWYICQYVKPSTAASISPEFVYQAPAVNIVGTTQAGSSLPNPPGLLIPLIAGPPVASTIPGYTYQIIRMPRRIGNPLELASGTCIDVAYCGIGPSNLPSNLLAQGLYPVSPPYIPGLAPLQSMAVMFSPGGGIDSIYVNNYAYAPATTVHFLIGRSDKVNAPLGASTTSPTGYNMFDPTVSNLADAHALWVSVARSTANVSTSDNLPPPINLATATSSSITIFSGLPQQQTLAAAAAPGVYLSYCRQLATNREQVRGQ